MKQHLLASCIAGIVVSAPGCKPPPPPTPPDNHTFVFTDIQELKDTSFVGTVIIDGRGCDNLLIETVDFSGPDNATKRTGLILQDVRNVTVRNCTFYNITGSGIQVGNQYKPCGSIIIESNEIREIDENGINSYYSGGSGNNGCIIRNNHIHHVGRDTSVYADRPTGGFHGIYWKDKGVEITGNEIHDNYDKGSGITVRAGARIARNRVYNTKLGINYTANYPAHNSDLIIENNLLYDMRESGITLSGSGSIFNDITAADIRFNTVVGNTTAGILLYNFTNLNAPDENNKFRIFGNVVVNENTAADLINNNPEGTNAKTFSNTTAAAASAMDFVDASAHDFHAQAASPAIDAGSDVPATDIPAIDFDGNPRPVGIVDHGAFERQ